MEWDNISLIISGLLVAILAGWLLMIGLRSSGALRAEHAVTRRPDRVRMYEAAEGRIDRLREKTFAELEAMPAHEKRIRISRRKRKFSITTSKRQNEGGSLHFTVVARQFSWVKPWTSVQLEEEFPPDHQPRRPRSAVAASENQTSSPNSDQTEPAIRR